MLDDILLKIAKTTILNQFDNKYTIDTKNLLEKYPYLNNKGAVFVTLKSSGNLRGCIGSVEAHRTLFQDLVHNSFSAGFKDPRFNSLHVDELNNLNLEVSVLSEPKILEYKDFEDLCQKLQPNIDGVILKHELFRSTFLPQVWAQLKTPKYFLEHLALKAGSSLSLYEKHPEIYIYHVDAIEEKFDEILSI